MSDARPRSDPVNYERPRQLRTALSTVNGPARRMSMLAVFNAKGGVAKTTTTVNLAACLAALGQRVLVVDLDYQGNATRSLGFHELPRHGSYDLITGRQPMNVVRHQTFIPGLSLVGATDSLAAVDVEMALKDAGHDLLRRRLQGGKDGSGEGESEDCEPGESESADLILLDCPPAMGILTLNALVSCTGVLIPSPPAHHAYDGLLRTWSLVQRIRDDLNNAMVPLGILPTLIAPGDADREDGVLALMRAAFGSRVGPDTIPREDGLFDRAAAHTIPACVYDPDAEASHAYMRTATRLLDDTGAVPALRALDDPAPDLDARTARGRRGLDALREAAGKAGLLDGAANMPALAPDPVVVESHAAPEEGGGSRMRCVLGALALSVLGTGAGFLAGWLAARGIF